MQTNNLTLTKIAELSKLFKTYNDKTHEFEPVVLTKTQQEIFSTIVLKSNPRTICILPTQYGKSFTVGLAVLLRALIFPEKWVIVAPSEPKAQIIMRVILDHVFDQPDFQDQLNLEPEDQQNIQNQSSFNRLKRERSKKRLTFKNGAEIMILSADTKNKSAAGESLMGWGCLTGETLVTIHGGQKTIKELVDTEFQGEILSFDLEKNIPVWKEISDFFPNQRAKRRLFKIKTSSSELTLTEDHPVYVEHKGYIPAKDVRPGDVVKTVKAA